MSEFLPCADCHRHVKGDATCPFCGDETARPKAGGFLRGRHGRAKRLLLGAAIVAGTAAGCGSSTTPTDGGVSDDAGFDAGNVVTPYGTPALLQLPI